MKKETKQTIYEAAIAGLLVFLLTVLAPFASIDYIFTDHIYQIPRGIDSRIKIIGIDEKTLATYGPMQTWSREQYANLLDTLCADEDFKPTLVCFDILFTGEVDEGDQIFADKCAEYDNVVVVNHLIYKESLNSVTDDLYDVVVGVEEPYPALNEATVSGFSNVSMDRDGKVRRILPDEHYNGLSYSTFAKTIYQQYCLKTGTKPGTIPTDIYGRSIINYSGKAGDYEYVSMADVLDGTIPSKAFTNSIVLVGAYAPGMQDNFLVPSDGSNQMYGVEIHANILQSYLQGRFSVNGNPYLMGLIMGLLAFAIVLIIKKLKPGFAVLVLIASIGLQLFVFKLLNDSGHAYSIMYFPLVLIVFYIYTVVSKYVIERNKRKKAMDAFSKYVDKEIINELSKSGDFQIKVGGENRDIAVLFVDIRGFTTMSEALTPEQVVDILNEYLTIATEAIFKNKGTLDKFVGDCAMAVFNSPFDLDDYEYRAVCAALDIVKGGDELKKRIEKEYGRSIGYGVGVNVGPAVVGNIGSDFRMDFTAIGDTVNTAARLEANAKADQVLISDVLYERLKGRIKVNEIGQIPLKGKSNGVNVFEVLGLADTPDEE